MTRAELQRRLHEVRVEAYAQALYDAGPTPANCEMEQRWRKMYRDDAEQRVSEYEAHGLFMTEIRVA